MTFTIDSENNITAHATPEEAAAATATPFDSFSSQKELAELTMAWPAERLVAVWNSLPGVTPVKKFTSRDTAVKRIWTAIQSLGDGAGEPKPEDPSAEKPKAARKPKGRAQSAKGAPVKGKATKQATASKGAPKAKKGVKAKEGGAPREGSKMAQAVAMLSHKNGVTLDDLASTFHWERHTVRGFVAGALKKAGYKVESFKSDKGERTYRINQ